MTVHLNAYTYEEIAAIIEILLLLILIYAEKVRT